MVHKRSSMPLTALTNLSRLPANGTTFCCKHLLGICDHFNCNTTQIAWHIPYAAFMIDTGSSADEHTRYTFSTNMKHYRVHREA